MRNLSIKLYMYYINTYIYNMATVTIAYNPNDFFYASSYNTPTADECSYILQNNSDYSKCKSCYGINFFGKIFGNTDIGKIFGNTDIGNIFIGNTDIGNIFIGNTYIKNCDLGFWNDMSSNCFKYELCKNKNLATLANNAQNNYNGADERYANIKKEYDYAMLQTINIVTGIIILGGVTYYYLTKKII